MIRPAWLTEQSKGIALTTAQVYKPYALLGIPLTQESPQGFKQLFVI